MNINNQVDLSLYSEYDFTVSKDRSLSSTINCTYMSGTTEVPFLFSGYTGATLTIKNSAGTILMTFSTLDGSIVLGTSSFQLNKTYAEMDVVRAGTYAYDMILSNSQLPKRGFLRGKITFLQNVTN